MDRTYLHSATTAAVLRSEMPPFVWGREREPVQLASTGQTVWKTVGKAGIDVAEISFG